MEEIKIYIDTKKLTITELISLRRLDYNGWGGIPCPLLNGRLVHFNKEGFHHLTHNGRGKIRGQTDQRMRLNLLPNARTVIKRATEFGAPPRLIPAAQNKYGKDIQYYELIYKFNARKTVAVVVRKIGNGNLHFYSIRFHKRGKSRKNKKSDKSLKVCACISRVDILAETRACAQTSTF